MSPSPLSRRQFLLSAFSLSAASFLSSLGCSPHAALSPLPPLPPPRPSPLPLSHPPSPTSLTLLAASRALRARTLSPVELTRACLDRIERLDPRLNSFITVTADAALADARAAERDIANGKWRGPLHGIPIGLKDNIDTAGVPTTAASALFADRVPTEDAEVVTFLKAAGAIVIGKQNMHEFADGTTSAVSHDGPVHNPWDLERVAGGSSGGSGAAVAADLCFGAVGTDTGGSIRIPSACCGIVGLKPTHGVVSAKGVIPVSTSFDCIGPMCRTVADAALMFRAMTNHPVAAAYNVDAPPSVADLRVGVLPAGTPLCDIDVDPEVRSAFDAAVDVLRSFVGQTLDSVFPMPDLGRIIDAEEYAFHAPFLAASPELYIPREREAILAAKDISEAELARLRQELARHRASIHESFADVDVMVLPTLPQLPILLRDATEPFAMNACTFAFSIAGLPSISIPCGFSSSGLPIGLLLSGPPLSEPRLLALAQAYENATEWHARRPSF